MHSDYRYERALQASEVYVGLVDLSGRGEYSGLGSAIIQKSEQYGYTFGESASLAQASEAVPPQARLAHLILLPGRVALPAAVDMIRPALNRFKTATLCMFYDDAAMQDAQGQIDALKSQNPEVNFLLPVLDKARREWVPSFAKIVDNATCDSVRIKYRPHCIGVDYRSDLVESLRTFQVLSQCYSDFDMFHRSPTDGFFAVRTGSERFLITATKTDKIALQPERISLVHSYSSESNVLRYSGGYLPSSDAVEAAIVMKAMPEVQVLMHTHASRRFTRNPAFASRRLVPAMSYGEAALGEYVVKALKTQGLDDFIIMEDHGEVFALRSRAAARDYGELLAGLCNS